MQQVIWWTSAATYELMELCSFTHQAIIKRFSKHLSVRRPTSQIFGSSGWTLSRCISFCLHVLSIPCINDCLIDPEAVAVGGHETGAGRVGGRAEGAARQQGRDPSHVWERRDLLRVDPGELSDTAGLGQRTNRIYPPENELAAENLNLRKIHKLKWSFLNRERTRF